MRVLHIGKFYPPRWGGMETALKDICETISPCVDLSVVVANDKPRLEEEYAHGFRLIRLPNLRTLLSQPLTPGLWPLLRREPAEIVHLHEPNPLALVFYLLTGHRSRLVIHYHSDIVRQRVLKWFYRPILERGLRRAEAIIAGSQELIDSSPILQRWRDKCLVIPFGIDLEPFLTLNTSPRQTPNTRRVLAVGRLSYYKGFHYLIESMQWWDGELTIVGEGEMRGNLEALIRALNLESRVLLKGRVGNAELLRCYAESDVFCLPSCERSEAFGLVMVEAMGAALPIVSTDLPTGVRAVNRHGETGLVVPPGDARSLAIALGSLLSDRDKRIKLGAAGRERAQRLFSREVMADSILKLYQAVVETPLGHRDSGARTGAKRMPA